MNSTQEHLINDTLLNEHCDEILNILLSLIGKFDKKKKVIKSKIKILELLQQTFPEITEEKLINAFDLFYRTINIEFKRENPQEINDTFNKFCFYILEVENMYEDSGYTLLLLCFFWLISDYR